MRAAIGDELESALIAGATDEAARPRFYDTLLRSKILVVPTSEMPALVDGVVPEATRLALTTVEVEGMRHVPFFSSERHIPGGTEFHRLVGR